MRAPILNFFVLKIEILCSKFYMLLRVAASYEQIDVSYDLSAREARQIANGGQPMTKEDIIMEMQGSLVVSERSMRLAIATVEYSNKIHILLDAHVYASTLRPESPSTRTLFYSDLSDTTLTLEKMRAFAKHVHNIFMATTKYNNNQVSFPFL